MAKESFQSTRKLSMEILPLFHSPKTFADVQWRNLPLWSSSLSPENLCAPSLELELPGSSFSRPRYTLNDDSADRASLVSMQRRKALLQHLF